MWKRKGDVYSQLRISDIAYFTPPQAQGSFESVRAVIPGKANPTTCEEGYLSRSGEELNVKKWLMLEDLALKS